MRFAFCVFAGCSGLDLRFDGLTIPTSCHTSIIEELGAERGPGAAACESSALFRRIFLFYFAFILDVHLPGGLAQVESLAAGSASMRPEREGLEQEVQRPVGLRHPDVRRSTLGTERLMTFFELLAAF